MASEAVVWRMVVEAITLVVAAAGLSAGLIVLLRPWLVRYAMARPNARSSHKIPTPQGGGIAVVAATLLVVFAALALQSMLRDVGAQFGLIAAATTVLAIVGAVDDTVSLHVWPRLMSQVFAVAVVVALQPADLRIASFLPLWIERSVLVLAGVWFVNLFNFMDGLDWMTVSEVVPVTIGLAILTGFAASSPLATLFALALLGATIGFAPFNRPVAQLFLGDVGSLPIGLLMFWLLLQLAGGGHLMAALLLPLTYVADATITLIRRLANGENITQAHRSHFYQRATVHGFSVPAVVQSVFAVNIGLLLLASATVFMPSMLITIVAAGLGCALVAALLLAFARNPER